MLLHTIIYEKRENSDKKRNARQLTLNIGDNVIMKRGEIIKKDDYKFYSILFKFLKITYTMVTAKSDNSKTYTGQIIFIEKVNPNGSETKSSPVNEKMEPKQYPKRSHNQVKG